MRLNQILGTERMELGTSTAFTPRASKASDSAAQSQLPATISGERRWGGEANALPLLPTLMIQTQALKGNKDFCKVRFILGFQVQQPRSRRSFAAQVPHGVLLDLDFTEGRSASTLMQPQSCSLLLLLKTTSPPRPSAPVTSKPTARSCTPCLAANLTCATPWTSCDGMPRDRTTCFGPPYFAQWGTSITLDFGLDFLCRA